MKRLRLWLGTWWTAVAIAVAAADLLVLAWYLDSDGFAAAGVGFVGAAGTRAFDIQREREARAISDQEIAHLTAEATTERQRLADEARRRDLDETRRLIYMVLGSSHIVQSEEIVGTLVNAVVHHSHLMSLDEALDLTRGGLQARGVKSRLRMLADRITSELGDGDADHATRSAVLRDWASITQDEAPRTPPP